MQILRILTLLISAIGLLLMTEVAAHAMHHKASNYHKAPVFDDDPRGLETLNWHRPGLRRVVTAGYPDSFGLFAFNGRSPSEIINVGDKRCLKANFLAFDIDDSQAFDTGIDTQLRVRLQIAAKQSGSLIIGYDGHGTINPYQIIAGEQLHKTEGELSWFEVTLPAVRLINRGMASTDLALTTLETMKHPADIRDDDITSLVLCDFQMADLPIKSGTDPQDKHRVNLSFVSENHQTTPVRFALYDMHGSQMLASKGAMAVPYYEDEVVVLSLRDGLNPEQFWPHENRYYQYSNGKVSFALEPGEYQLLASKGPEYRLVMQTIRVTEEKQQQHNIQLQRFANWQQKGWYSGDVHVHMNRKSDDDVNLLKVAEAEDLHVTNLLTMSNIGGDHYTQPYHGEKGRVVRRFGSAFNALVPGVEAPRTAFRGHGLSLNISALLKNDADYFLYHKYFLAYQQQGAINGYAHIGSQEFNGSWGLALDVPFGLVDFAEIMQNSRLRTQIWYEHLQLGHRIAPAAGSDFPYFDQPGAVRTYVHNQGHSSEHGKLLQTVDAWFAGLKAGRVFVSNGPLLDFRLDGVLPGGELDLKPHYEMALEIALNPQLDHIKNVEIFHCGETLYSERQFNGKNKAGQMSLQMPVSLPSSGWVAVKVTGEYSSIAHSGAIYIKDGNGLSVCPDEYQPALKKMLARLHQLSQSIPTESRELEYWESRQLISQYRQQSAQLQQRIELARQYYRKKLRAISDTASATDSASKGKP